MVLQKRERVTLVMRWVSYNQMHHVVSLEMDAEQGVQAVVKVHSNTSNTRPKTSNKPFNLKHNVQMWHPPLRGYFIQTTTDYSYDYCTLSHGKDQT